MLSQAGFASALGAASARANCRLRMSMDESRERFDEAAP